MLPGQLPDIPLMKLPQLLKAEMPLIVEATFMPFKDVIISDGLVMPYFVIVGNGMKRMFKDVYLTAKKNGRIHRSL